jgi:hypothetical protein
MSNNEIPELDPAQMERVTGGTSNIPSELQGFTADEIVKAYQDAMAAFIRRGSCGGSRSGV